MTGMVSSPRPTPGRGRRLGLGFRSPRGSWPAALALSALFATTGFGLPCPFLALTGWQCPLCGGTRMGSALLHGDLVSAFWPTRSP